MCVVGNGEQGVGDGGVGVCGGERDKRGTEIYYYYNIFGQNLFQLCQSKQYDVHIVSFFKTRIMRC